MCPRPLQQLPHISRDCLPHSSYSRLCVTQHQRSQGDLLCPCAHLLHCHRCSLQVTKPVHITRWCCKGRHICRSSLPCHSGTTLAVPDNDTHGITVIRTNGQDACEMRAWNACCSRCQMMKLSIQTAFSH